MRSRSIVEYKEAGSAVHDAATGTAEAGDVLFKKIDNSSWYLVCWMSEEKKRLYSQKEAAFRLKWMRQTRYR